MATIPFPTDNKFLQEVRDAAFRFAQKHCGSWATAEECEDLTQDAMTKMYENVQNGRLKQLNCNLSTYVNGILKNLAKKMSREKDKEKKVIYPQFPAEEDDIEPIDMAIAEEAIRQWSQIDQEEELAMLQEKVREMVTNMEDPCRRILWAFYWEGKSMKEIAKEMNYSSKDVAKTRKSVCLSKVRAAMKDFYKQIRS